MTAKHLFAASFCLRGMSTLPAQAPALAFQMAGLTEASLGNLFSQLAQFGMAILVGMIVLVGIAWVFCIWNACAGLNKKRKNTEISS